MYSLNDFLSGIRPFIEGSNFEKFKKALENVPNCEAVFQILLRLNPSWSKLAKSNGVYFLLREEKKSKYLDAPDYNQLYLRLFSNGNDPTIEVITFI